MIPRHTRTVCVFALVLLAGWLATACAPTYTPECRGDAANPLSPGELSQPSGMVQVGDRIYVANAASIAPPHRLDYCGSFVTAFDAETGDPVGRPFVPEGDDAALGQQYYRFFAGIAHDPERDVLYVAERQTGSVLRVDPQNGRILDRVDTGESPYGLQWMPGVVTADTEAPRDLLAVADIGVGRQQGRVWVVDAATFSVDEDLSVELTGRPSVLDFDPDTLELYVGYYDGVGVAVVDLTTGELLRETEAVADEISPTVRGVAVDPETDRLFFTAEQQAFRGLWVADRTTGRLVDHVSLPRRATDVAIGAGYLVALAPDRLYIHDAATLSLLHSEALGIDVTARLLLDAERGVVYVTGFNPSAFKIVRLP